jgi:hypothetical protein
MLENVTVRSIWRKPSKSRKKNARSFTIGPPNAPPNWLRFRVGFTPNVGLKKPVALNFVLRLTPTRRRDTGSCRCGTLR